MTPTAEMVEAIITARDNEHFEEHPHFKAIALALIGSKKFGSFTGESLGRMEVIPTGMDELIKWLATFTMFVEVGYALRQATEEAEKKEPVNA